MDGELNQDGVALALTLVSTMIQVVNSKCLLLLLEVIDTISVHTVEQENRDFSLEGSFGYGASTLAGGRQVHDGQYFPVFLFGILQYDLQVFAFLGVFIVDSIFNSYAAERTGNACDSMKSKVGLRCRQAHIPCCGRQSFLESTKISGNKRSGRP